MTEFLSGKVRKTPPTDVPENRYKFLQLKDAEPDLGVALGDGYILTTDELGVRTWKLPSSISGFLGSTGYTGSRGEQGFTGSIGFTGSQGPAGGEGSLGYTGSVGFSGSVGFTGSQGVRGAGQWTPVLTNVTQSLSDSTVFIKTGGVDNTFDAQLYSLQGYVRGAYVTVKPNNTTDTIAFGLNNNPTTGTNYENVDYGIYLNGFNSTFGIVENGVFQQTGVAFTASSIFTIIYDGANVRYWHNNTLLRTVSRSVGNPLYLDALFYDSNAQLNNVGFGPMGETGTIGFTGSRGVIGFTGSNGDQGFAGSQGIQGFTGSQGIQGWTGSQGIQGWTGSQGFTGSQGAIGFAGSQGIQGFTGSSGFAGSQGIQGFSGSKGDTGMGFTIAKVYVSVAALLADTSPTGIVAGQFALIETGNVEDAENSRLYLWDGVQYIYVTDLSGAQGIRGFAGSQGAQGFTGSSGFAGSQGIQGFTGSQGIQGFSGSQGIQGFTGSSGFTGSQGDIGFTGSQGAGFTGSRGDLGFTGSIGFTGSRGYLWSKQTTNYTIMPGEGIIADTSGGPFTITLPLSPSSGMSVAISDGSDWAVNNLTVARNGSTIEGIADDFILDINDVKAEIVYDGTTWQVYPNIGQRGEPGPASGITTGKAIAMAIVFG